ncbi:MAG: hypothetical protein F6J86_06640 [Symploca sp. SIO1B1]|nr:hypothetical protein [Symploca sp. SIO1B1]
MMEKWSFNSSSDGYFVGGNLACDSSTYVTRTADHELFSALKNGMFCYVLNSRQMGKSSLRVRTKEKLEKEGIACVEIDISGFGTKEVTSEQWYSNLAEAIIRDLIRSHDFPKKTPWYEWWEQNKRFSVTTRFTQLLSDFILPKINKNLVIMIDEIDTVLSLDFLSADFFNLIRSWYEKRAGQLIYRNLTFAVFGVLAPSELIRGTRRKAFNVAAKRIELHGFKLREASPLRDRLNSLTIDMTASRDRPPRRRSSRRRRIFDTDKLIKSILYWTGGQPFLTQKLCHIIESKSVSEKILALKKSHPDEFEKKYVAYMVREHILNDWKDNDDPPHLKTIHEYFLTTINDYKNRRELLKIYHRILNNGTIKACGSPEHTHLLLSGLVIKQGQHLKVFNPIYTEVFDENWIDSMLSTKSSELLLPYTKGKISLRKFFRIYKMQIRYLLLRVTILGILAGGSVGTLIWIKQSYPEIFVPKSAKNHEQLEPQNVQRKTSKSEQEKGSFGEFLRIVFGIGATEGSSARRGTTTPQSTPEFQDTEIFNTPEERQNQDSLDPQSSLNPSPTVPPGNEFFDEKIFDVPKEEPPTKTRSESSVTPPIPLSTSTDEKSQPFTISMLNQAQTVFTGKEWQIIDRQFLNTPFLGKKGISPFESNFLSVANGISKRSTALQQGGTGLSRWALLLVDEDKLGNYYAIDTRQVQALGQDTSSLGADEPYDVWRIQFVLQIAFPHLLDGGRVAKRHVLLEGECPEKFNSKRQFAMKRLWFADYDTDGNQVTVQQIDEKIRLLEPQGSKIKYEVLVSACEAAYDYPRYLELLVEGQKSLELQ